MSNMGSSTYYERPKGETTEWEDILRAKGILPPSEDEKLKVLEAAVEEAKELMEAERDHLAEKSLDELDELEDEFSDSRTLEAYRRKRMEEMRVMAAKNKFGRVYQLSRDDFVREITDASKECWVALLLYKDGIPESRMLEHLWPQIAAKHKATKFMKIVANQCIENYPDRNVPTIIMYHEGEMKSQIVGLSSLAGMKCNVDVLEWVLSKEGVVSTELEEDPRKALEREKLRGGYRRGGGSDDDDD